MVSSATRELHVKILKQIYFILKSVKPDKVNKVATKCFSWNSSSRKMIDNKTVTMGAADTMTDRDPVELEDFSNIPNMTAPQTCTHVVIIA